MIVRVVSSTFDNAGSRHIQVAKMVIEKAKCLVEQTRDMVILLDSITCLALVYSTIIRSFGKVLMGGVCLCSAKSQAILWCGS